MLQRIKKSSLSLLLLSTIPLLNGCVNTADTVSNPPFAFAPTTFDRLPNWEQDDHAQALQAFRQSCKEILRRRPYQYFGAKSQMGKASDWQPICRAARHVPPVQAKAFFEYWFKPYQIQNNMNSIGLFTGYYLPVIPGSLVKTKEYSVPIHALPPDLVKIRVRPTAANYYAKSFVGQIKNHKIVPYPSRATITKYHRGPVIAWSKNELDVFFAQVQGSALIELPDHKRLLVGYAAANGRPYTSIGRILVDSGAIPQQEITMETIKAWLLAHPQQMHQILNQNQSYVFFKTLDHTAPFGTEHIPLTAERSLAVDTRFIPLGAPVWVNTFIPNYPTEKSLVPYRRLFIAQDTGGAINGKVRADVYWGEGERAAFIAGRMQSAGQYWILLPR